MASTIIDREKSENKRKLYAKYLLPQSERLKERVIGGKAVQIKRGMLVIKPPVIKRIQSEAEVEVADEEKKECDLCQIMEKPKESY